MPPSEAEEFLKNAQEIREGLYAYGGYPQKLKPGMTRYNVRLDQKTDSTYLHDICDERGDRCSEAGKTELTPAEYPEYDVGGEKVIFVKAVPCDDGNSRFPSTSEEVFDGMEYAFVRTRLLFRKKTDSEGKTWFVCENVVASNIRLGDIKQFLSRFSEDAQPRPGEQKQTDVQQVMLEAVAPSEGTYTIDYHAAQDKNITVGQNCLTRWLTFNADRR